MSEDKKGLVARRGRGSWFDRLGDWALTHPVSMQVITLGVSVGAGLTVLYFGELL